MSVNKNALIRYCTLICFFTFLTSCVVANIISDITPRATDYYRNQSFKECLSKTSNNSIFVLTKEQINDCSSSVEVLYRGR